MSLSTRRNLWTQSSRLAIYAILAGFTFQLGACPCGCLEHNAWVEAFEGSLGHDEASGGDQLHLAARSSQDDFAASLVSNEHDHHDCDGVDRRQYFDTSRKVTPQLNLILPLLNATASSSATAMQLEQRRSLLDTTPRSHAVPVRATLQVFLL